MPRPGRKRVPAVARQPNGRKAEPSRVQRQEAATAVVKRQRLARGATNENYTSQAHATPIGRLWLTGGLGRAQTGEERYQTAVWYAALYHAQRLARDARKPYASLPGNRTPFEPSAEDCIRAIARHRDAERLIPARSRAAIWAIVICEQAEYPPAWVAALLPALDAMTAHRIGVGGVSETAAGTAQPQPMSRQDAIRAIITAAAKPP